MRVVVVGGGFGGLASAARLAKLGHEVTLLERGDDLGGALASVTADGFTWDAGPTTRCSRPCCATCSASPGDRWSASSSWSRSEWCVSTASRTARSSRCPADRARLRRPPSTRSTLAWAPGGRRTSTASPTRGSCCVATTSSALAPRARPARAHPPAAQPRERGTARPQGVPRPEVAARGRHPRWPRGTSPATCRPGRVSRPTSSSGWARGRCPAAGGRRASPSGSG